MKWDRNDKGVLARTAIAGAAALLLCASAQATAWGQQASREGTIRGVQAGASTRKAAPRVKINAVRTYQRGQLVYVSVRYSGPATGFGFKGINGSGWGAENHPFAKPSYGKVSRGRIDYPFNHLCGTSRQYESDIQFWLNSGHRQAVATTRVHLRCKKKSNPRLTWINLYDVQWLNHDGEGWESLLKINGRVYPGSFWNPYSRGWIDWNIDRKCVSFRSVVGMTDDSESTASANFDVIADGRVVGRRDAAFGQAPSVTADITGALRLRLAHNMTSLARGGAAYGTPQVLCSGPLATR